MADKKSFILYLDYKQHFDLLTNEQKGILINALFDFAENGESQTFEDKTVEMAFSFISLQIKRDSEKYEEICEKRRIAGQKGGAPKGNSNASKQAKGCLNKQKQTKQPDTDNDTDNENDNDTDNEINKSTDKPLIERDFEECWKIYPKKQGKKKAFEAYKRAVKRKDNPANKEIVINGINNYLEYIRINKIQEKYIKQGATYFCNEGWNDEYSISENTPTEHKPSVWDGII